MSDTPTTRLATLQAVLDNAVDAIISMDQRGRLLTFNRAAERLFQYSATEVAEQGIEILMPDTDRARHPDYVESYLAGGPGRIIGRGREVTCRRRDGSNFQAHLSISESAVGEQRVFTAMLRDLSERDALTGHIRTLSSILEHALSALYVFTPANRQLRYANAAALRERGETWETLSTQRFDDVFATGESAALASALARLASAPGTTVEFDSRFRRANGAEFPVLVQLASTEFDQQPAVVGSVIDISRQRRAEEALSRNLVEHQAVLQYAPVGIVTMNRRGGILTVNAAALRIAGYTERELLGKPAIRFMHTDEHLALTQGFGRLARGEAGFASSVHRMRHRDGHYFPVRTFNAAIHGGASQAALMCLFEDLSEQHARDEEIKLQRERLAHVAQLTQMGEMAAGLAHELNQPLSAITNYAGAGRRLADSAGADDDNLHELFVRIGQQAERAGNVIRKVRELTRRHESTRERHNLDALIRSLLPLVDIDLNRAGVTLDLQLGGDVEVWADHVQIEQVLLNFIRNAVDASADVDESRRRIRLSSEHDGSRVRVAVADRGAGGTGRPGRTPV